MTPPNLTYQDPLEPTIAAHTVIARARRVRRRRRLSAAGSAAAAVAAVALGAAGLVPAGRPGAPSEPANPLSGLDSPVVVGTPAPGWQAIVYLSPDDDVCGGTVAVSGSDRGYFSSTCGWASPHQTSTGIWVMKPLFQVAPIDKTDQVLAIGLVRGNAASVTVRFLGHDVTANVVPADLPGSSELGAYAVWLPLNGATTYGWSDIDIVIARDSRGDIVAKTS